MSASVNQRWPDGLRERVASVAGERGVTRFTVEALEAALGGVGAQVASAEAGRGRQPSPPVPVSPRASYAELGLDAAPSVADELAKPPPPDFQAEARLRVAEPRAPLYRCRVPGCDFTAGSATAFCGAHPGRLLPKGE